MKFKKILPAVLAALSFIACDDTTTTIGSSLIDNMDHLLVTADTFEVSSRSIAADSVLGRTVISYLGTVRDPETGEYITANFMTQFHTLEDYELPPIDSIASRDADGNVICDSVDLRFFFDKFYGDSLTSMKLTVHELDRPIPEGPRYYSNFDPKAEGFIREGGLTASCTYALVDYTLSQKVRDDKDFTKNICVHLNDPYTDRDGVTYNNFGTYLMRKYYENPAYYKNSYSFIHSLCPGFYVESTGGLGSMAYIQLAQLNFYFSYQGNSAKEPYRGTTSFSGTEEVLQTNNFVTDRKLLKQLVDDPTCTYLKTPAGIFTELTLPIDDIVRSHVGDSINSANITLSRLLNDVHSAYSFTVPQTLLMLPKDSLYSFFENNRVANNKVSYIATYNSLRNTYTFNNIGSLITAMHAKKAAGEATDNWNKVVIVPVSATYSSVGGSSYLTRVCHDLSFSCTRLIGGPQNPRQPIKISVIYSKYK